jgi:predicted nucleotidyltransferase
MSIEERIEAFKTALADHSMSDEEIVQRFIVHGSPFVFAGNDDLYFDLKARVARQYGINPDAVKMVGSAKLGFSIAPTKLWKYFDEASDIDVVIISDRLFREFWRDLYGFNINVTARSQEDERLYRRFLQYFFKGWLRPDLFPFSYSKKEQWFEFFKSMSYGNFGYRKVAGAIFSDMHFFETYHVMNIAQLRAGG